MRPTVRLAAMTSLLLSLSLADHGAAQPTQEPESEQTPQDRALAEALFREGKRLGEEGKIPDACLKFKESQRLDPTLGTLLHLAACYAEEGKTASAWAAFNAAADLAQRAKQKERETLARERAAALEEQLARITISVAQPTAGLVVELDGRILGEGILVTPLPVDPGVHVLKASAPGKREWSQKIEIAAGPTSETFEVPALEDTPPEPAPAPPPAPVTDTPAPAAAPGNGKLVAGLVIGGVGIASVGVGSFFGLRAASQAKDADAFCRGSICTQQGIDGHDDARGSALVANILFGIGIAGVGVGTYLVVTSSSGGSQAPQSSALWLGTSVGQISAGGSF